MGFIRRKKRSLPSPKIKLLLGMFIATGLIVLIGIIPLRLAITLNRVSTPEAVLVLGGNSDRMKFAAQFWQSHPQLDIWVSDYRSNFVFNRSVFQKAGVPQQQIHYDFCPTDTVTNFTCLVKTFAEQDIQHLYLITSDYHMTRARAIATLVLGSRGIVVTPVAVTSKNGQLESLLRVIRDCIRSLCWIVTRQTGASFNLRIAR
jgi:uncharacterized SAM-binding protein YcdF (DUF218 family)